MTTEDPNDLIEAAEDNVDAAVDRLGKAIEALFNDEDPRLDRLRDRRQRLQAVASDLRFLKQ